MSWDERNFIKYKRIQEEAHETQNSLCTVCGKPAVGRFNLTGEKITYKHYRYVRGKYGRICHAYFCEVVL